MSDKFNVTSPFLYVNRSEIQIFSDRLSHYQVVVVRRAQKFLDPEANSHMMVIVYLTIPLSTTLAGHPISFPFLHDTSKPWEPLSNYNVSTSPYAYKLQRPSRQGARPYAIFLPSIRYLNFTPFPGK